MLSGSEPYAEALQIREIGYHSRFDMFFDDLAKLLLQGGTARHYNAYADHAFSMKPLEVLEISVKKRVFVVPLDFERDGPSLRSTHMVNLMGSG